MKLLSMLFLCVLALSVVAEPGKSIMLIDDCDDGNIRTLSTGWWYTYTDSADGGNSKVFPPHGRFSMDAPGYGKSGKAAHMKGFAGNKLGWDYVGIGFTLSNKCGCPIAIPFDMREYKHLRFVMKGTITGGRLVLVLQYTDNGCESGLDHPQSLVEWADYETDLTKKITPKWTKVCLELRSDFHQPDWTKSNLIVPIETVLQNSKNLNFQFASPDGDSIDVWIDNIELTK